MHKPTSSHHLYISALPGEHIQVPTQLLRICHQCVGTRMATPPDLYPVSKVKAGEEAARVPPTCIANLAAVTVSHLVSVSITSPLRSRYLICRLLSRETAEVNVCMPETFHNMALVEWVCVRGSTSFLACQRRRAMSARTLPSRSMTVPACWREHSRCKETGRSNSVSNDSITATERTLRKERGIEVTWGAKA